MRRDPGIRPPGSTRPAFPTAGPSVPAGPRRPRSPRFRSAAGALAAVAVVLAGCSSGRDVAEVHRRLSLRIEHRPPERALAGEDAEIRARVQSSLEVPQLSAWIRVLQDDGTETRIPLRFVDAGDAVGRLPARDRGHVTRYVLEAKDAAGLVVSLPPDAREGKSYTLRFEGRSWPVLGGIAGLSAWLATFLFLGAGAAAVQALRGQLSVGPSGLLGGLAVGFVFLGIALVGGVHAFQVTGRPWPNTPMVFAMSRGDLALLSLLWAANLTLGRRALLDEEADGTRFDERLFASTGTAAGVLAVLFLFF